MKIRELEYSRTFNLGKYESERIALTVELDPIEDLNESFRTTKAKVFTLHEVGNLLEASKTVVEAVDNLDNLPWKPYKSGHRGAWIFADTKGAEKLVELIKESQTGKVPIGEFEYRLSHGEDRSFVSRNPIKK